MKILAIMGSYRKGKTIDTLIDKAIEGAKAYNSEVEVEKVSLIDLNIKFCMGCMTCFKDDPSKEMAKCAISDDMNTLNPKILEAEGYIFGTPVFMAHETAIMKQFLERICWIFAKPAQPRWKKFCDDATPLIKETIGDSLNAKVIGTLYAGAVMKYGVERYKDQAYDLGIKLASQI